MENKELSIRYCIVNDSLWYSINDITKYLKEKKAITNDINLNYCFAEYFAKGLVKSKMNISYLSSLQIKPFDKFINWVVFHNIYSFCKKSDKEKIRSTNLLQCIDLNNISLMEKHYPLIYKSLKQITLIEQWKSKEK